MGSGRGSIPQAILTFVAGALLSSCDRPPQAGDLAPDKAADTLGRLRLACSIPTTCDYPSDVWQAFVGANNRKPDDQYMLGIYLMTGDKVLRDEAGGSEWIAMAAYQGYAKAALELNHERRDGSELDVDERRIAAALRAKVAAGDTDAMRALSDMTVAGRGVERNPDAGVALLRRAAAMGSASADEDLGILLYTGAPGVPQDRKQALAAMSEAGRRGDTDAMETVSHWLKTGPEGIAAQPAEGYRWLMRAALLGDPQAQEELSTLFANGLNSEGNGVTSATPKADWEIAAERQTAQALAASGIAPEPAPQTLVAPDLVEADRWFRIASLNPWHNNPAIRAQIEPRMTTTQLDQAKREAATWHPLPLVQVMAMPLPLPNGGTSSATNE
jgi:TPR repeat protein